jgi:hypothetical protein
MCLSLRDDHGQLARLATNYDGLIISVLAEAQAPPGTDPSRRLAGPCPLRGMRRADVVTGDFARLAATVSLVLAAAKARDHATDGDGIAGRPGLRQATTALARNWESRGTRAGSALGFDTSVLTAAVSRQEALEAQAGPGTPLLAITEPTETATGAAFGYTALLAGRPGNEAALTEAGRLFGRIAHLLDAVEDLPTDIPNGTWNPLAATRTPVAEARRLCQDALAGIRLALADADFTDRRLVDALLGDELRRSVRRTFGHGADADRCAAVRHQAALGLLAAAGLCAVADPRERPPGRRRRGCGCCRDSCRESCGEACCEDGCGECCGACCDNCDCSC